MMSSLRSRNIGFKRLDTIDLKQTFCSTI